MNASERYHGLDFVRAIAMLLGLVLHVCIFFMPADNYLWFSGEYSGDPVNRWLLNFIHLFRMELFFLMAGFFAELVIIRKGFSNLVRDRAKRILMPFIFGVLIGTCSSLFLALGIVGDLNYEAVLKARDS